MKKVKRAYYAGIMDGRGAIYTMSGGKPYISIVMQDFGALKKMHKDFGGSYMQLSRNRGWLRFYGFRVAQFLSVILPYLQKHRKRARCILRQASREEARKRVKRSLNSG